MMLNRLSRTVLSPVLSAMMLAGTLIPPGVRHAHGGVDGPFAHHQHDQLSLGGELDCHHRHDIHHHQGRSHGHARRGMRIGQPSASICSNVDRTWHLHLTLLGIDFTLPDSDSPAGERDDTPVNDIVLVCVTDDLLASFPSSPGLVRLPVASFEATSLAEATAMQAVRQAPPPVTAFPLCDRARQERSGVLLA